MSPPIRDGSGNSIGSIRLGDGSEISEVRTGAGDVLFSAGPPDSGIYLQDDFGDSKLQNRDDSATTTTNGLTGTYRPGYTIANGNPTATNSQLETDVDDKISTTAIPDLSDTAYQFDLTISDRFGATVRLAFYSTTTSFNDSYFIDLQQNNNVFRLRKVSNNSNVNIINADQSISVPIDVRVTHDGSGNWELFKNGSLQGTGSDTEHTSTTPSSLLIDGTSFTSQTTAIDEYKLHP